MAVDATTAFLENQQGRYVRPDVLAPRTRTVWAVGDSLTAGVGAGAATPLEFDATLFSSFGQPCIWYGAGAWETWALLASQSKWTFGGVFATGGFTAAQILAVHVPQVIAAASPGDTVNVLAGTNGFILADVEAIHAALHAAGLYTVACTIPPINNPANFDVIANLNEGLKAYCAAHGIPLVDIHGALVNPASGQYATAYVNDGIHPNEAGFQVMGQLIAAELNSRFSTVVTLVDHNVPTSGQLPALKPLATGGVANTDWFALAALGTSTIAVAADADFKGGNAYVLTRNNTDINMTFAAGVLTPGHRVRLGMAIKFAPTSAGVFVLSFNSNATQGKILFSLGQTGGVRDSFGISRFYVEFVVPVLPDYAYQSPHIQLFTDGVLSVGELTVLDLTLMGAV